MYEFVGCTMYQSARHYGAYYLVIQLSSLYPPSLHICLWLVQPLSGDGAFLLSTSGMYFFRVPSRFSFFSFTFCRRRFLLSFFFFWGGEHVQNRSRRLLGVGLLYKTLVLSAMHRFHIPVDAE